jgi:hypothetical protein
MAQALHQNENANMSKAHAVDQVSLDKLNMDVLHNSIAKSKRNPSVRVVSTCSVLAKAQQIANNTSLSCSRDKTRAVMDVTPATFFDWWGSTRDHGLNGHSVCVGMKCSPVISTKANEIPVNITLVSADPDIVEGTGIVRETLTPAPQMATLNVVKGQCSQQCLVLQKRLDSCIVLNSSAAANIKSLMHATEMTQMMANNALNGNATGLCMGFFSLPQKLCVPSVSAIQSYSLNGEAANTTAQREIMANTMFYAVGLACGIGPLYSLDLRRQQHSMDTSLDIRHDEEMSDPEAMRRQTINKMKMFPGTPFMRSLLPEENIARIVVAAPCSEEEKQRLRTLGAFMGLNKLDAESYLKLAPASFMPLHLRQSMIMCPSRNCLTPLSALQLRNTASFSCGVFAKSPFLSPMNGNTYVSSAEIEANMHAIYTNTCNVIGCLPVITGTCFSDSMMIVYP